MNTLNSKVTDKDIEESFKKLGCDVDVSGEYGEPERFSVTNDSLQEFVDGSARWLKCGQCKKIDNSLIFKDVSTQKGETTFDLYVVDFGDIRIACKY
jgi:hypothetical protein